MEITNLEVDTLNKPYLLERYNDLAFSKRSHHESRCFEHLEWSYEQSARSRIESNAAFEKSSKVRLGQTDRLFE